MANLARKWTWKKWAPDIGENRELPEPALYLELATGLTPAQVESIRETLAKAYELRVQKPELPEGAEPKDVIAAWDAAGVAYLDGLRAIALEALTPYVRVHGGPHTVDGQPLATLEDYLKLVQGAADKGVHAISELREALYKFNSLSGPDELFSLRRSGGARSTDAQSTAKAASPTDAR